MEGLAMTQWFRGNIEGYYVGKPERAGFGANNGRGFGLVVYRAAIRDVELLDFVPPKSASGLEVASPALATIPESNLTAESSSAEEDPELPPLVLPPWLPAPGVAFFQPTITDARLFPVRHAMGWFEGPVHQVFIEDFRSTHSKQHGHQLYGRFEGRVSAYFALPPAPRPESADRLVRAFQDLPDDAVAPSLRDPSADARAVERDHAEIAASILGREAPLHASTIATSTASETLEKPSAAGESSTQSAASNDTKKDVPTTLPSRRDRTARVPFLILVILVAAALLLTCGAPRALLWLFFLLPTLLVRRIVGGLLPDSTSSRGFSALLTLGQAWLAGMVFVGWWESGCRDVHPVPLLGTLAGLFLASVLPSDIPLLVNASTLAAMLLGWCTGKDACVDAYFPTQQLEVHGSTTVHPTPPAHRERCD
jgi:hypothetical protein